MKSSLAWLPLIAVAASYPVSAGGADQPPKRSKYTCAQISDALEQMSKTTKYAIPVKVTRGSWGDVPAPLRKLPAGAELCGVGSQGQVIIVSAARGKELEDHYAPLFAEVGCKPLKCSSTRLTDCSCSSPDGSAGVLLTDVGAESYTFMYSKPLKSKAKK
jgi:hypothetical protein